MTPPELDERLLAYLSKATQNEHRSIETIAQSLGVDEQVVWDRIKSLCLSGLLKIAHCDPMTGEFYLALTEIGQRYITKPQLLDKKSDTR